MTFSYKAGAFMATVASASLAVVASLAVPAAAADLGDGGWGRGSIKDYQPAAAPRGPVGPCYFRADVGYSLASDPHLNWNATAAPNYDINREVSNTSLENSWLVEGGYGCGSGSRGLRSDLMLGYHGDRTVQGQTALFDGGGGNNISSRIFSSIQTYTAMANVYYDFGNVRGFVPYVGAGVGLAYHRTSDYYLPDWASNPPDYRVRGANDLSLAWSLMAGAGYQISDRAILDFGYRYIDMGSAQTARNDNTGSAQVSRLYMTDLTAHEFKIGLRYHLGAGSDCCSSYAPLK